MPADAGARGQARRQAAPRKPAAGGCQPEAESDRARLRRGQILDAAAECFCRHGFHAASIAEISKTAGMSAGHIYNYFDSKDAIVAAIVERGLQDMQETLARLTVASDLRDALLGDVDEAVTDCLDETDSRLQLELCAEAGRNERMAALVRAADAESMRELTVLVRRTLGPDLPQADIEGRVEAIAALFDGLSIRAVRNPGLDREALAAGLRRALTALLSAD